MRGKELGDSERGKILTAEIAEKSAKAAKRNQCEGISLRSPDFLNGLCGKSVKIRLVVPLLDAELFFGVGTETFRSPGRSPNNIHCAITDAGQLLDAGLDLCADVHVLGAALRGQRHFDGDVLLRFLRSTGGRGGEIHFVDQAEVDEIDWNLGIVATLQSAQYIFFGDGGHCNKYLSSSLPYSCGHSSRCRPGLQT